MTPDDVLSDLLRFTQARSVAAGGFTAGGAWSIHVPPHSHLAFAAIVEGSVSGTAGR